MAAAERETILAYLHDERFQDRSPAAVYSTLLDERILMYGRKPEVLL